MKKENEIIWTINSNIVKPLIKWEVSLYTLMYLSVTRIFRNSLNRVSKAVLVIAIKTKEKTNRIVWAYGSTTIDKKVIELYNELLTTTKLIQNEK